MRAYLFVILAMQVIGLISCLIKLASNSEDRARCAASLLVMGIMAVWNCVLLFGGAR